MIFTWLYLHTQGSVLLATILHGAIDTLGFQSVSGGQQWPIIALVYAALAALLVVIGGAAAFIKSPSGEKEEVPVCKRKSGAPDGAPCTKSRNTAA